MKEGSVPNALRGIAGVHHVVAELSCRGLVALPTVRNTAGYDIIASTPNGKKHANIQVKTTFKRGRFFPMPLSGKIKTGPEDWYILLRRKKKEKGFEGFMLRGFEAKREVRKSERDQGRRKNKKLFPCIYTEGRLAKAQNVERWKMAWLECRLFANKG